MKIDSIKKSINCFCLISFFLVSCSKSENDFFINKKVALFEHAKETTNIDYASNDVVEWTDVLFDNSEYVYFKNYPRYIDIPDNYIYQIGDKAPKLFAYYGEFKGYDVFSWDDDNTFGYAVHGFSIDRFVFQSTSYHILYCIKHTGEQTNFFTLSEDNTVLHYNHDVVIPFVNLYTKGIFDLQDVGYLYYARNNYLKENNSPYVNNENYTFEMTSVGQYRVKCPNIDLANYNISKILFKDFIFKNEIPLLDYSYAFPKELDKHLKNLSCNYDNSSIVLAKIAGYDIFKIDMLDKSKIEQINATPYNLKDFVSRRYLADLNITNIYGFKDGKVYQIYDLLLNKVFGINTLDAMACQIYANLFDARNTNNDSDFDFKQDFYNRWKNHYLTIPSL